MLHLCNFLKMNLGNGKQQIVRVGFVRHTLNTPVLSKHASFENCFWNPTETQEKNNMPDNIVETKNVILQLIPPKHV